MPKIKEEMETEEFQLEISSSVEQGECYICGEREDSLMPYYAKRDSIGIVHWNQPAVTDSEVRAYDDDGQEVFGQDGTRMSIDSFGEGYGSIWVSGTPDRGYTDIKIHCKKEDEIDLSAASKILCQRCLDQVVEFYTDQKNYGDDSRLATTGYCLVDFTTRKLYTLSDPYRGYFIRDYYVTYDIEQEAQDGEGEIDIFLAYMPKREPQAVIK